MRSAGVLSMIGCAMLTSVAVAIAPIPTPVPQQSARPLVVNRPIFATSAPLRGATTVAARKATLVPKHRQPIPVPVKKDGGAKSADAVPQQINRSTPVHRVPLGW